MENKDSFTILDENGIEKKCDILFTFDKNDKSYIVYTDKSLDEDGNIQVFASIYTPNSDVLQLMPIETEKEWKIIEIILEEIQSEIRRNSE